MKIINKDTPIYDRRIILVDDIINHPNYDEINSDDDIIGFSFPSFRREVEYSDGTKIVEESNSDLDREKYVISSINGLSERKKQKLKFAFATTKYSFNNFDFPPQHPQKGIIYSSTDFEPNFYIPLSTFHQYSFDLKQSAFIEMCAHLGAKEIILLEEIIDDVKTNLKVKNELATSNSKIENENTFKNSKSEKTSFRFPKPVQKQSSEYESNWIKSEPTWRTLQKIRIENNVSEYNAELNYTDEMGINFELATKLIKNGLNIGGSFQKIKKTKRVYKVVFWD